ncbi:MAG: GNAT family N-acetyltransferase [Saprospiraceae bacterium]|nr:GNAT family N-acetyltransferase [Saprospiraceae bacterium]
MIILETERLIMRPPIAEDAQFIYQLNTDPDVIRYTPDQPFKNIEAAQNYITKNNQFNKNRMGRFSIFLKSDKSFIGWCGLQLGGLGRVDLGYRLTKAAWGKGYATESAVCQLEYGFTTLGLEEIIAFCLPDNHASIRIIEKLGFKFESDVIDRGNMVGVYVQNKSDYLSNFKI